MNTVIPILKRIVRDGRSRIPSFLLLTGLGLIMTPIDFYGLLLSRKLIDRGFMTQNWELTRGILLTLVILFLMRGLIGYGTALFSTRLQLLMNQAFQNRIFSHIIHLPVSFFTREPTGRLMSRVLEDAAGFSVIFNLLFGPTLLNPLRLLALLLFLMYIDVGMCLLMLISTFLSLLVIRWTGRKIRLISMEIQKKEASLYSFVEQVFPNIELIKSRIAETKTAEDFNRLLEEMVRLSLRELGVSLISSPLMQMLKYLAIGGAFAYGSWLITRDLLSFGTLSAFLGTAFLFFNTLNALGNNYRSLRGSLARMEVIYGILDSPLERSTRRADNGTLSMVTALEFRDVSFGYQPSNPVLKGVSFHVFPGETLAITGQSGSGKTTLMRLLLRFYEPDSGEIRLNHRPMGEFELDSLRSALGIAFQDNLIMDRTVMENIACGNHSLSRDMILRAAGISGAHDFILTLPDQYDTFVGEGGKGLSGGERQRIAIARAIVTDPDILILDEATSFLEVEQEAAILKRIKETRRERITIIISHRLSAVRAADRVLTLDNGLIIEPPFRPPAAIDGYPGPA